MSLRTCPLCLVCNVQVAEMTYIHVNAVCKHAIQYFDLKFMLKVYLYIY